MSEWTPGPWRYEIDADTQEPRVYAPMRGNQLIAVVGHYREDLDTAEPTARLIAAAPELADALRGLLKGAEAHIFSTECQRERDAARAALAKLERREP